MIINYDLKSNGKGVLRGARIFTGIGSATIKFNPPNEYFGAKAYAVINGKTYPIVDWTVVIDALEANNDELEITVVLENLARFKCETLRALISTQAKELATSVNTLTRKYAGLSGDLASLSERVRALESKHKIIL